MYFHRNSTTLMQNFLSLKSIFTVSDISETQEYTVHRSSKASRDR